MPIVYREILEIHGRFGKKSGRFSMTVRTDEGGDPKPVGCCADKGASCFNIGHATKEEAEYFYQEWKANGAFRAHATRLDSPKPCAAPDCGAPSDWELDVPDHGKAPMCVSHRNVGGVKALLRIPEYFADPRL